MFSKKTIFGYRAIAFSSVAIAIVGFLVWGHHMFISGQSTLAGAIFSFLTFLVAIPSAVKVFNWLATMYRGSIDLRAPMLYAISFLMLFSIGGLTGIYLGALAVDVHLHDTYFIVAHFHYVMMGGTVIAFLGGLHYWWPKMFGRMYNEKLARIACALVFIGFNVTFFTQFLLGTPRDAATLLQLPAPIPGTPPVIDRGIVDPGRRFIPDRRLSACHLPQADGCAEESLGRPYARMGDAIAAHPAQLRFRSCPEAWTL